MDDSDFTFQTSGISNHAAWTLGHVAVCVEVVAEQLGGNRWLPPEWRPLFGTGSRPTNQRPKYPTKDELLTAIESTRAKIRAIAGRLSAKDLVEPLPNEAYHANLPTIGHGLIQLLVAHTAYHSGQLALWRKAAGYPPINKHFL